MAEFNVDASVAALFSGGLIETANVSYIEKLAFIGAELARKSAVLNALLAAEVERLKREADSSVDSGGLVSANGPFVEGFPISFSVGFEPPRRR